MKDGYLPKDQRKKILLLSDDARLPSGVGTMSREIIFGTAHRYNWVQVAAAINHPEQGKLLDASDSLSKDLNIPDASLKFYPYNGYGDPMFLRHLIKTEKPDAILHFTDPRYWIWLYQMEHEIRDIMPLMFYHVWDDLPFPMYNKEFYLSCDYIACISKQTYNIVRNVAPELDGWQAQYVPHGINENHFFPLTSEEDLKRVAELRKHFFKDEDVEFVVFYNNRNIRRKMTGDVVLAYQRFLNTLPVEKREKCRLLLHTQPVDENGTDLVRLIKDVAPDIKVVFSIDRVDNQRLNDMYNMVDVTINLASNEGFGLGTAESLMAGTPIIVNVTGGLQDQCGFTDEKGNMLDPDVHFGKDWGSNHDGKYTNHGMWARPIFPSQRALIGSPPTPYIFDDRCKWEDAADAILETYRMGKEVRKIYGKQGRDYLLNNGMSATAMCDNFITGFDRTFKNWKPRERIILEKI